MGMGQRDRGILPLTHSSYTIGLYRVSGRRDIYIFMYMKFVLKGGWICKKTVVIFYVSFCVYACHYDWIYCLYINGPQKHFSPVFSCMICSYVFKVTYEPYGLVSFALFITFHIWPFHRSLFLRYCYVIDHKLINWISENKRFFSEYFDYALWILTLCINMLQWWCSMLWPKKYSISIYFGCFCVCLYCVVQPNHQYKVPMR